MLTPTILLAATSGESAMITLAGAFEARLFADGVTLVNLTPWYPGKP